MHAVRAPANMHDTGALCPVLHTARRECGGAGGHLCFCTEQRRSEAARPGKGEGEGRRDHKLTVTVAIRSSASSPGGSSIVAAPIHESHERGPRGSSLRTWPTLATALAHARRNLTRTLHERKLSFVHAWGPSLPQTLIEGRGQEKQARESPGCAVCRPNPSFVGATPLPTTAWSSDLYFGPPRSAVARTSAELACPPQNKRG